MLFNVVHTDEEYIAQGFTKEECPMIRRHDILMNQYKRLGFLTEEEDAELMHLIKVLKI
jgi:hypothetical protein